MSTDAGGRADQLVGRQLGDFIVEERIGEGSFGAVYRARQPRLGRTAALKLLHTRLATTADATERFLREARTASSLDHPYAAHIYDSGAEPDGTLWIAMEYVRGTAFSEYLREHGPLPLERFLPFFARVCEVVHSAHEQGIVHRDIKPANIMVLSRSGRLLAKLLDFGVAKAIAATAEEGAGAEEDDESDAPREQSSLAETVPPASDPRAGELGAANAAQTRGAQGDADAPPAAPKERQSAVELGGTAAGGSEPPEPSSAPERKSDIALAGTATGDAQTLAEQEEEESAGKSAGNKTRASAKQTYRHEPHRKSGSSDVTRDGQLVGSPFYMAPEQWDDAATVDARCDIYALGIVAYEALTRRRPFTGQSVNEIARAHRTMRPPAVPDSLPSEVGEVFAKALAKRPEDRYENALALAEALQRASGLSDDVKPLPSLDAETREHFTEDAPRPLADAIATLERAKELRQARDALGSVADVLAHYAGLLALGAQSRFGRPPGRAAAEILRRAGVELLSSRDWLTLAEALCESYAERPELHPMPELVEFFYGGEETAGGKQAFEALWGVRELLWNTQLSDDEFRETLERAISSLSDLLRRAAFLCDYPIALPSENGEAERLTGLRRGGDSAPPQTFQVRVHKDTDATFRAGQVYLFDADRAPVLCLHPLLQVARPAPDAPPHLFLFAGGSSRGGKLVAAPLAFERHDEELLDWLRLQLGASLGSGQAKVDTERAPYLGLEAFASSDADLFVGREDEIDTFTNRLLAEPLLAVVGPSGAGKSSFIQAGVIPALKQRQSDLRTVVLRPGAAPISTLASQLSAGGFPATGLESRLRDNPRLLGELLREEATERGEIAIVVDQFEELFTLTKSEEERRRFAEALVSASRSKSDPVRVILSLRDDFLVRAEGLSALQSGLSHALTLLTTPSAEELERIVREPARRAGYEFEDPDLPARMVAEVEGEPGALALLSFTATKLWERRDRHFRRLPTAAYEEMGGVGGALSHHADALLEAMPARERRHVREAFRLLVTSEGTRAVLGRRELLDALGGSAEVEAAIEHLVKGRLLVISEGEDGEQIEVAHETLLTSWPLLVTWRREDAESARLRDQLRAAAVQWDRRGRPTGLLWHGDALAEYRMWRSRYPGALTHVEEDFGRASLAEAQKARRRRQTLTAGAFISLAVGLAVVFTMARQAGSARELAEEQRTVAEDREAQIHNQLLESYLEQGSEALRNHDYFRALLFLTEAYGMGARGRDVDFMLSLASAPFEGRIATHRQDVQFHDVHFGPDDRRIVATTKEGPVFLLDAEDLHVVHELRAHQSTVWEAAWHPDGDLLATGSSDGRVALWDPDSGSQLRSLGHGDDEVFSLVYNDAGTRLVTGTARGVVRVYNGDGDDLVTGPFEAHPAEDGGVVTDIEIGPDGRTIATGGVDGRVRLWELETGQLLREISHYDAGVDSVAFSPVANAIVSTSRNGGVQLVNSETGELIAALDRHKDRVYKATFSPNGEILATAGEDETVELWDAETGSHITSLEGHNGYVRHVDFRSDNEILTAGADGMARRWDAGTGSLIGFLPADVGRLSAARYSGDGSKILVGSMYGGAIAVWDAESLPVRILDEHEDRVIAARYGKETSRLLTVSHDGTAHVRDGDDGGISHTLSHPASVNHADMDAAGETVALLETSGKVALWPTEASEPHSVLETEDYPSTVRFSPEAKTLFVSGRDAGLWDVAEGRQVVSLATDETGITSADFLPGTGHVIAASDGGLLEVFESTEGESVKEVGRQGGFITDVDLSPGGEVVATSSQDGTVRLWNADEGSEMAVLDGHDGWVWSVDFGPEGKVVASAGADSSVRLWSVESRRELARLKGHQRVVRSVSFSPDGRKLASGSEDATARIWRIPRSSWDEHKVRQVAKCLPLTLVDSNPVPVSGLPEEC